MIGIYLFIALVGLQRVFEMRIAKRNARWMKSQGGYEVGKGHYPFIVLLHSLFFVSLLIEVALTWNEGSTWKIIPLSIFLVAQMGRVWTIMSLDHFWNTRIIVLPGAKVVAKGPYKYVRHPNYIIVALEIAAMPLIWNAYWTAILFTLLNGIILSFRIKEEEKALKELTNYDKVFAGRRRFMPKL